MRALCVAASLVVALAALVGVPRAAAAAARPNIVVVLTDDQRWDQLALMPNVQRELVGRGVTFTNAFAVNPLCCPSRATLLTGRYSHSTRIYRNHAPYGGAGRFEDQSTLATWLAAAGYRTGFVGKYLNGYWLSWVPPGWSRWVGYNGGYFGYGVNQDGLLARFGHDDASYSTDVLAGQALSFAASGTEPFFLLFAPFAPHEPATPAPRHAGALPGHAGERPPSFDEEDVSDKPRWVRDLPRLPEPGAARTHERRMLESLRAVDEAVGALVDGLRERGQLERTVIVFLSDNGLLLGEHRQLDKKVAPYEESIRVPLVLRYDGLGEPPRREARLVANVDIAPTLAELAQVPAPGSDGASLVPLLAGNVGAPVRWRRSLLVEHLRARSGTGSNIPTYCAVRRSRWKYVVYETREEELYDLAGDPHELENLAGEAAPRTVLSSLRSALKRLCNPPPPGMTLAWLCTVEGAPGERRLLGTAGSDRICGRGHGEEIRGLAGADRLLGAGGPDVVAAGPGRDHVDAGHGADVLLLRDGEPDRARCGRGRDRVRADRRDSIAPDCEVVRR